MPSNHCTSYLPKTDRLSRKIEYNSALRHPVVFFGLNMSKRAGSLSDRFPVFAIDKLGNHALRLSDCAEICVPLKGAHHHLHCYQMA